MKRPKNKKSYPTRVFTYIGIVLGLAPALIISFQIHGLDALITGPVNQNIGTMILGILGGLFVAIDVYFSNDKDDAKGLAFGALIATFLLSYVCMFLAFLISLSLYDTLFSN